MRPIIYWGKVAVRLSGKINTGESFCDLFGRTELFSADLMASLYVD